MFLVLVVFHCVDDARQCMKVELSVEEDIKVKYKQIHFGHMTVIGIYIKVEKTIAKQPGLIRIINKFMNIKAETLF